MHTCVTCRGRERYVCVRHAASMWYVHYVLFCFNCRFWCSKRTWNILHFESIWRRSFILFHPTLAGILRLVDVLVVFARWTICWSCMPCFLSLNIIKIGLNHNEINICMPYMHRGIFIRTADLRKEFFRIGSAGSLGNQYKILYHQKTDMCIQFMCTLRYFEVTFLQFLSAHVWNCLIRQKF